MGKLLPFQEKLRDFIKAVPEGQGGLASGSPPFNAAARAELIAKTPETTITKKTGEAVKVRVINPTTKDNEEYKKLTGYTHRDEVMNWAANGANNGTLTSCNAFVGECCVAMGSKMKLSTFWLPDFVAKHNKPYAFIWNKNGEKPGYGDIFTHFSTSQLHMGISLGFEGDVWKTIEGGQGGPRSGVDFVKRKDRKFDSHWDGWVDMAVWLDSRGPVPDWLLGIWTIYCGNGTYHYRFNRRYEVLSYPWRTHASGQEPPPNDTGTVALLHGDTIEITWSREGGKETFEYQRFDSFPGILERMKGKTWKGEALSGVKA